MNILDPCMSKGHFLDVCFFFLTCYLRHFYLRLQASPEGQAVFDRLLKACNEVIWKGESVIVLNQIQVDPPYAPANCRIISPKKSGALENSSLERVKKIVAASDNNGKR